MIIKSENKEKKCFERNLSKKFFSVFFYFAIRPYYDRERSGSISDLKDTYIYMHYLFLLSGSSKKHVGNDVD